MDRKLQVILSHHAVLGLQAVELLGLGGREEHCPALRSPCYFHPALPVLLTARRVNQDVGELDPVLQTCTCWNLSLNTTLNKKAFHSLGHR